MRLWGIPKRVTLALTSGLSTVAKVRDLGRQIEDAVRPSTRSKAANLADQVEYWRFQFERDRNKVEATVAQLVEETAQRSAAQRDRDRLQKVLVEAQADLAAARARVVEQIKACTDLQVRVDGLEAPDRLPTEAALAHCYVYAKQCDVSSPSVDVARNDTTKLYKVTLWVGWTHLHGHGLTIADACNDLIATGRQQVDAHHARQIAAFPVVSAPPAVVLGSKKK